MTITKKEERESQRQLRVKLKLERKLTRKMRNFFASQNKQVFQIREDYGITPLAETFKSDLTDILERHYYDTAEKFVPREIDDINKALVAAGHNQIDKDDDELWAILFFYIRSSVQESATSITRTSDRNIAAAIQEYGTDKQAYRALQKQNLPRSETIAATETQKASEGSKQKAANHVVKNTAIVAAIIQMIKVWATREDGKVRPAHASANGQEVPLEEPFVVGGELLMYPGDYSYGASLWNLINCRCVSIHRTRILS